MMTNNQRIIAQKDELIARLSWHRGYDCYNKNGFEEMKWPEIAHIARWIICFDVDGVHPINEAAGTYDVFNAMMKDVLSQVRSTDVIAGQYNSGDEFLLCITEPIKTEEPDRRHYIEPKVVVERLKAALAKHGLTAHFAIAPVRSSALEEMVKPAFDEILAAKRARGISR